MWFYRNFPVKLFSREFSGNFSGKGNPHNSPPYPWSGFLHKVLQICITYPRHWYQLQEVSFVLVVIEPGSCMVDIFWNSSATGSRVFQKAPALSLSSFFFVALATSAQYCVSSMGVRIEARASKSSSCPPEEDLWWLGSLRRMIDPRPFSSSVIRPWRCHNFCSHNDLIWTDNILIFGLSSVKSGQNKSMYSRKFPFSFTNPLI